MIILKKAVFRRLFENSENTCAIKIDLPHVTKLEESVELAPKLTEFYNKLKSGQNLDSERKELRDIFAGLKANALLLKEKGNQKLIEQIHYWLDNTVDQMNALEAFPNSYRRSY